MSFFLRLTGKKAENLKSKSISKGISEKMIVCLCSYITKNVTKKQQLTNGMRKLRSFYDEDFSYRTKQEQSHEHQRAPGQRAGTINTSMTD